MVEVDFYSSDESQKLDDQRHWCLWIVLFFGRCPKLKTVGLQIIALFERVIVHAKYGGAVCVVCRATVIERGNMWFRDDGALTRVFCEDSKYIR